MADFTLRRCVAGDEPMLSLLGGASFLEAFADVLDGPDILAHWQKNHSVEKYAEYLAAPENRIYVAEMAPGNAPVGYTVCTAPDFPIDTTPDDYELRRIYLLYRFQGLGIGRALMDQAIVSARELGYKRLLLGVYGENFGAIRFYEKAGFTQIGERFFTVGATTHHDAVMAKPL
ncbi:GNAT family N-acetyltransferase [Terriglobus sp.]|uniref:GNAT family N-acetyltransferase n=1 Tax=Terriglobus sp. TaxID=1889013 RepID=UPI003AFF9791